MFILRLILKAIFKILGWKIDGKIPDGIDKAVIVFAPHTSNWDAFFGLSVLFIRKVPVKFYIKKEYMFFPLGNFLKFLGAVYVDRGKVSCKNKTNVDLALDLFQKNKKLFFLIQPEGTRKYVERWKLGFYHIAQKANLPLLLSYIDYEKKIGSFGPIFNITGNLDEDLEKIKNHYRGIKGKFPERGVR